MSDSESDSSSSGSSEPSDEAASDPPTDEEPAAPSRTAKDAAAAPAPRPPRAERGERPQHKAKKKEKRHKEVDEEQFLPSIDALQGRWRHSVAGLGMLSVKKNVVSFSDGTRYVLTEISPGRIDMDGWQTIASKSTPEVIVWMLNGDPSTSVNWLLEEDADDNTLEGLDARNIIQGKRRRTKVDYAALEKQIDEEQRQHEDVFSDASSSSGGRAPARAAARAAVRAGATEDSVEMTPKEWSQHHATQSKKAASLFRQWMLTTCTSRHEEVLRRKGRLQTRLPVALIGPGRRLLEQELLPYAVKLRYQMQETVAIVDQNCRLKFQERHAGDWAASSEKMKDLEKRKAFEKRRALEAERLAATPRNLQAAPGGTPEKRERSPASDVAMQASPAKPAERTQGTQEPIPLPTEPIVAEPTVDEDAPTPRARKRLRRVVDSDDEAPPNEEVPGPASEGGGSASTEAAQPESILQAKEMLDASRTPEEVLQALTYLETQTVDHNILVATKIGVTVNGLRKSFAQHPEIARRATVLVKQWREIWEQYQGRSKRP